jgi:hypothetical protein
MPNAFGCEGNPVLQLFACHEISVLERQRKRFERQWQVAGRAYRLFYAERQDGL